MYLLPILNRKTHLAALYTKLCYNSLHAGYQTHWLKLNEGRYNSETQCCAPVKVTKFIFPGIHHWIQRSAHN